MTPIRVLAAALACAACAARADNASIVARVADAQGRPLADAVVVAVPADGSVRVPGRPRVQAIDQVDKEFAPRVKAVVVGTPVMFPNHDNVRHHVYSFSPAKRFELPLYAGVPAQPVVFDKPGVVVLGCNIHDWMVGYVYVSESPHFAQTDASGGARIGDLAAGRYVVRVWHPQMEGGEQATRRDVDLSRGGAADVAWTIALKPEVRVRRTPDGHHGARY
jgi:plastocyanin